MSGQQHQAGRAALRWMPGPQGGAKVRPWTADEKDKLRHLVHTTRLVPGTLAALAAELDRTEAAVAIQLSALRAAVGRAEAAGGAYAPALVMELEALARREGRLPSGALAALAVKHGRTIAALKTKMRDLRAAARDQRSIPATRECAVWRIDETAAVLALLRAHPPKRLPARAVKELAVRLGRTEGSVQNRVTRLRRELAEQDGEGAFAPVACVGPAHDGRAAGRSLDVSSHTLAAAVPAHVAPRSVSPAAGAASEAAPAGVLRRGAAGEPRLHQAELRAAHPPERVRRKCLACRQAFTAQSRFRFRCDGCLKVHANWTGYDA